MAKDCLYRLKNQEEKNILDFSYSSSLKKHRCWGTEGWLPEFINCTLLYIFALHQDIWDQLSKIYHPIITQQSWHWHSFMQEEEGLRLLYRTPWQLWHQSPHQHAWAGPDAIWTKTQYPVRVRHLQPPITSPLLPSSWYLCLPRGVFCSIQHSKHTQQYRPSFFFEPLLLIFQIPKKVIS